MTLRIDNQTDWDGRSLRKLCRRVIEHTDGVFNREILIKTSKASRKDSKWKRARLSNETCQVGTANNIYRGRASVNSRSYLYMGVPKVERQVDGEWLRHQFDPTQFARVLEHEILHNQGLRHGDMRDDVRYCRQEITYDLSDISVSPKPTYTAQVPESEFRR